MPCGEETRRSQDVLLIDKYRDVCRDERTTPTCCGERTFNDRHSIPCRLKDAARRDHTRCGTKIAATVPDCRPRRRQTDPQLTRMPRERERCR